MRLAVLQQPCQIDAPGSRLPEAGMDNRKQRIKHSDLIHFRKCFFKPSGNTQEMRIVMMYHGAPRIQL